MIRMFKAIREGGVEEVSALTRGQGVKKHRWSGNIQPSLRDVFALVVDPWAKAHGYLRKSLRDNPYVDNSWRYSANSQRGGPRH